MLGTCAVPRSTFNPPSSTPSPGRPQYLQPLCGHRCHYCFSKRAETSRLSLQLLAETDFSKSNPPQPLNDSFARPARAAVWFLFLFLSGCLPIMRRVVRSPIENQIFLLISRPRVSKNNISPDAVPGCRRSRTVFWLPATPALGRLACRRFFNLTIEHVRHSVVEDRVVSCPRR